jgi:hypothetical protein
MDNFSNSNFGPISAMPAPQPLGSSRKPGRAILLSVVGLIIAVGFLAFTGGFNNLSKIFGSHAGTTYAFGGYSNLTGATDAESWVLGESYPASYQGTSGFTSFTGVPDPSGFGAGTGFISPIYSSLDPAANVYKEHTYVSPVLNLGTGAAELNTMTAYVFLPNPASNTVRIRYRTTDDLASIKTASLASFSSTPTLWALNERIHTITAVVPAGSLKSYVQFDVEFLNADPAASGRPAFYGVELNVSDVTAAGAADTTLTNTTTDSSKAGDMNGDGVIDILDYTIFMDKLKQASNPGQTP